MRWGTLGKHNLEQESVDLPHSSSTHVICMPSRLHDHTISAVLNLPLGEAVPHTFIQSWQSFRKVPQYGTGKERPLVGLPVPVATPATP
jgi:hypothetical protein